MRATVAFKLAQLQQKKAPVEPPSELRLAPLPVTNARLTTSPAPDYPEELNHRRLPGQVVLEFTVEADGTTSGPKVLWASHAGFVGEALLALKKYRFEPARQGLLALRAPATQGQMDFESQGSTPAEVLVVNQLSVIEPEKFQQLPKPALLPEPVYPRELLLAGETGSAVAEFTITGQGMVEDILLKEVSNPEFGAALTAAMQMWHFDPARFVAEAAVAKMVVNYKFVPPASDLVHRLVLALQPGGAGVGGASGLDERLRPLWRVSPVYPQALRVEKPVGKAMIEFIIDRDGRCRLPQVVSASQPEFGWAAAAAISQWVFAPPLRGGQPVDVKASIPVDFAPPKD
jgi:TonB family protein